MRGELDTPDQVNRYADPDRIEVNFWYPRIDGHAKFIEVGLEDVRAADSIRIHYDFDRDGFAIEQSDNADHETWAEVAFIRSWSRGVKPDPQT
jgi:hypothetical protein